jgi:DNA-binding Xre family transcriptional regulator
MKKMKFILSSKAICAWLLKAREGLELSQGKAADAIGITQMYLSTIERGAATLINIDQWKKIASFYVAKGVAPLTPDPLASMPDPAAMRKEIQEMKDATKSSFKEIASSLGIGASSLTNFMKGEGLKTQALYELNASLTKLRSKPTELAAEKALDLEAKPATKRKYKKKSLIEQAPTTQGLPSLAELDVMELQVIQRLRARHEQASVKPKHLNGHRH